MIAVANPYLYCYFSIDVWAELDDLIVALRVWKVDHPSDQPKPDQAPGHDEEQDSVNRPGPACTDNRLLKVRLAIQLNGGVECPLCGQMMDASGRLRPVGETGSEFGRDTTAEELLLSTDAELPWADSSPSPPDQLSPALHRPAIHHRPPPRYTRQTRLFNEPATHVMLLPRPETETEKPASFPLASLDFLFNDP